MDFSDQLWKLKAACLGKDPLFDKNNQEAKAICLSCIVRDECLDFALANSIEWGIWGGLNPRERMKIRRGLRKFGGVNQTRKMVRSPGGRKLPNAS